MNFLQIFGTVQGMKPNRLLEGSVLKSIFAISIPIIFANTLQTVYQLIDTFWVGRLGESAVAAVSLGFPILFFLISLALGFAMAGSILIAQYNGKGDKETVSLVTGQTFSIVLILALIVTVVGYKISYFLLSYLTHDPLVLSQAVDYLQISFLAIPGMFLYTIFQSALRGVGKVKFPMFLVLGTVLLNFFLDPIFMFGWRFIPPLGVSGVAWATLITEYLSAIVGIGAMIHGGFGVKLRFSALRIRREWFRKIVHLGVPSSLEHSSRAFGMFLMTFLVSTFGTTIVAAYGVGTRILSFVIIPAIGFSIATSALVGNNLGAKQYERVEKIVKTGIKVGFISLSFVGLFLFLFAHAIAQFFVPNAPELVTYATYFIRIMALSFGCIGIQMVVIGTVKAAGQTMTSMFLAMFHTFSLFVFAYLLSTIFHLQEWGIWIAYPTANLLALGLALYFYFKKDWLDKELV